MSKETERTREERREAAPLIIGLGASAGGLEALQQFFDHMPNHSGLSFVVVQHLSPDYKSLMADILGKHTEMTVLQAENGMAGRGGHGLSDSAQKVYDSPGGEAGPVRLRPRRPEPPHRRIFCLPGGGEAGTLHCGGAVRHRLRRHQRREGGKGVWRPGHCPGPGERQVRRHAQERDQQRTGRLCPQSRGDRGGDSEFLLQPGAAADPPQRRPPCRRRTPSSRRRRPCPTSTPS